MIPVDCPPPGGTPVPSEPGCADCDSIALTALDEGHRAQVTCLRDPESGPTRRLMAIGVLPGAEVELIQRYPAFVVRMGHADVALDEELAARIRVRAGTPG